MQPQLAQSQEIGIITRTGALLEAMRPEQWIKNGFVLAPLLFSANLTSSVAILHATAAFALFSACASGVYIWNDASDWRSDLVHPEKCRRPIPSGRLSPAVAQAGALLLLTAGIAGGFTLNLGTGMLVAIYSAMNMLYSMSLKRILIVDIMCISLGFVFRVMAGSSAIGVTTSHWLLMCTFLLALCLAIAKRRQELLVLCADSPRHRTVLKSYKVSWLDQAGTMLFAATLVSYALYTVAPDTQTHFHTDHLIYTLPFVVYGILRYLYLMHDGSSTGNPSAALIRDMPLLLCIAGWAVACACIIYL